MFTWHEVVRGRTLNPPPGLQKQGTWARPKINAIFNQLPHSESSSWFTETRNLSKCQNQCYIQPTAALHESSSWNSQEQGTWASAKINAIFNQLPNFESSSWFTETRNLTGSMWNSALWIKKSILAQN